jgi:hypothetical protein
MLLGSINLKLIQLVFWQFIVDMIEKNATSFKKLWVRSKIGSQNWRSDLGWMRKCELIFERALKTEE